MTGPYFVDANVFVYAGDYRDAVKQRRATDWLDYLWREQRGRTSPQALYESYVTIKRLSGANASPGEIWQRTAKYFSWDPIAMNVTLMKQAREIEQRFRLSWWDSMIVAAAQLQDCALLLTEDLQDGMVFGAVTVRSPFTLEAREADAAYAARPQLASLHRPRGRPRRALTGDRP